MAAFDAIVVGSGFGGAINALRLTEAGKRVLVLERGRRWQPEDFPRDVSDIDRVFWRYPRHRDALGLYDVRFFSALGAVVASGVGGGSLIYANIHIRPDPVVFEDPRWPRAITRATLDPFYDRVAAMLGVAPLPAAKPIVKRDIFRAAAATTGHEVFDPDQAVDWTRCQYVAECEFGCSHGAKSTIDRTYLAKAEAGGATVVPHVRVEGVTPAAGGYKLSCREVVAGRAVEHEAPLVVLSAGTLGTNEILLRSRDRLGTLPHLSSRLGFGYSANGDFLGSIAATKDDLQPWHGSDVTSVMRFFDATPSFTLAAPTFNRDTMLFLAGMAAGGGSGTWLRPFAPLLWRLLPFLVPLICQSGLLKRVRDRADPGAAAHLTNLFAIGRDNANGLIRMSGDTIDVTWDYPAENAQLVARMERGMNAVAETYGGKFAPLFSWQLFRRILTVHSLGGCHIADGPDRGVVTPDGAVHSYRGLYIADGSIVPASIGFHPCMTISALAERVADHAARYVS
jgi:cholesterol oxidase